MGELSREVEAKHAKARRGGETRNGPVMQRRSLLPLRLISKKHLAHHVVEESRSAPDALVGVTTCT